MPNYATHRMNLAIAERYGVPQTREGPTVAGSEPVTAPDQHKPINRTALRIGAVTTIIAIVLMVAVGNHHGRVENYIGYTIAGIIALVMIGDEVLRRTGLRR